MVSYLEKRDWGVLLVVMWRGKADQITGMDIPEMFLLAEAVLIGLDNVTDGLVVYPARIRSRFLDELPFMVTEAVSVYVSDSGNFSLIFPRSS